MNDREQPTKYITILRGVYNRLEKKVEELEEEKQKLEEENKELRKAIKQWNINGGNLLKENVKLKKVIEILKNKQVNIDMLTLSFEIDIGREAYNACMEVPYKLLTQEEYNLLKEVIGNE